MRKVAVLFPGQGSQHVGMLRHWTRTSPRAAQLASCVDSILGYSLTGLIAEGPEGRLAQTEHTQPAIVLASLCHWEAIRERLGCELVMAGHSVGEYSALAAAGWYDVEQVMRLVALRGEIMSEAAGGVMTIVTLNGALDAVQRLVDERMDTTRASYAAFNSSVQFVLSGEEEAVAAIEAVLEGHRDVASVQRLRKVSCAFHSPLMRHAAERFRREAAPILATVQPTPVPVISNVTAAAHRPADIAEMMERQIVAPVRWQETIQTALRQGCTELVTMQPGRVLHSLLRRDPTIPKDFPIDVVSV